MLDEKISPMLAYSSDPFDSPRHIFEIKWDGTRCILFINGKNIRLQNRRLLDITDRYPELHGIYKAVNAKNTILDGELIALSEGKPDFKKLQQREHISDPFKIRILSREIPITYIVFDLLYLNDKRYTDAPLLYRKDLLAKILLESPLIIESQYISENGKSFFRKTIEQGLEGIMAKSIHSPYLIGKRSRYWLKIKPKNSAVCYVIGYTKGKGFRTSMFGALALATREKDKWVYRGRVGSGFSEVDAGIISSRLVQLKIDSPPSPELKKVKGIQWLRPELRCEVIFQEETEKGHFRAPVFKRLSE